MSGGQASTGTRHTVTFNEESEFFCDVHQFERAVAQGELATAVSLYQGELAPGLAVESAEFEAWLRQEREHLHQQALAAMERLTEQTILQGDFAAAQVHARQQLRLEPWLESAHRQLMRALALSGDRNGALAQFEACQELLADELGIPHHSVFTPSASKLVTPSACCTCPRTSNSGLARII